MGRESHRWARGHQPDPGGDIELDTLELLSLLTLVVMMISLSKKN